MPRFAKVISHKYAEFRSPRAQVDLEENHGRAVSRCLIRDVADAVACEGRPESMAPRRLRERHTFWPPSTPAFGRNNVPSRTSVGVSLEGLNGQALHYWAALRYTFRPSFTIGAC